jgi:3-deoxy-D-manno-octulosonic-acid transferase
MGGSLLPFGSQNLIEANALGCPVVLGPSIFNFQEAAVQSIAAGAAVQVADSNAAVAAALEIAGDPGLRARMSRAALDFAQTHRGATDRTLRALEPLLERGLERS